MAKAYDTYHKSSRNDNELPGTGTIRNQVALANEYYDAALEEIAENGGSKTQKAAYTKKLNDKKYFLGRAEAYLAAINTNLNPAKRAFTDAVEVGKQKTVLSTQEALNEEIAGFEATVAKIYGPDARRLLLAKYAAPAQELADSVNDEMKVYKAYKEIESKDLIEKDLAEAYKQIEDVKEEVASLKEKDSKLAENLLGAVEKNNAAFEKAAKPVVTVEGITDQEQTDEDTKTITVKATNDAEVKVFLNDKQVEANENGTYTLKLVEGKNDVDVEATAYGVKADAFHKDVILNSIPAVESVKAVNDKTVEVKLEEGKTGLTAKDFAVLVDGKEVTPSEVKSDEKGETYTLTVAGLEGKDGKVSVNGKEAAFEFAAPKVSKVDAANLKTIVVTLSKAVDKTTVKNSGIVVKDGTSTVETNASLSEDGKTLYIENDGTFTQGKEYSVSVDGLKTTDDKEFTKYEDKVTVLDTTLPTVDSVKATSPKTLSIKFSEPVDFATASGLLTNKVQVDGINVFATNVTVDNATNTVEITLATGLTAGAHKVKIDNVNDFANFPIAAKEFDVTLAEDTAAPAAVSATALNSKTVRVAFNEPIDAATVVPGNFKVISGTSEVDVQSVTPVAGDSKQVEIVLNGSLDLSAVVTAEVKYNNLADNYGNKVTTEQKVGFKAQDDTVLPTVTNVTVKSGNTAEITFSEDVKNVSASDFALYDKDDKEVTNAVNNVSAKTIDGDTSKKVYTATFNNASDLKGSYTLKLKKDNDIKDLSIRENSTLEQSVTVTFGDVKAPEFTTAIFKEVGTNYEVTVGFNEAMLVSSLTEKANYIVDGKQVNNIEGSTVSAGSDSKSVVITVPKASVTLAAGEVPFKLLGVKDAAGNTLDSADFNTGLTAAPFVQNPALTAVVDEGNFTVTSKKTLKIPVASDVTVQNVDVNKVSFVNNSTDADLVLQATGAQIKTEANGSKYIELSLLQPLNANGTLGDTNATVGVKFAADAILLDSGATTQAFTTANGIAVADNIAPSLVVPTGGKLATEDAADTVTLAFDEAVQGSDLDLALVVKDKNGTRINPSKYTASVVNDADDNKVAITFTDVAIDGPVTVSLSDNVVLSDGDNLANNFEAVASDTFTVLTAAQQLEADQADVDDDKAALTAPGFKTGEEATTLIPELNLPETGTNGTVITWASDAVGTVTNAGVVTRPATGEATATVTLTATITKGSATSTQTFTVSVPNVDDTDALTEGDQLDPVTVTKN